MPFATAPGQSGSARKPDARSTFYVFGSSLHLPVSGSDRLKDKIHIDVSTASGPGRQTLPRNAQAQFYPAVCSIVGGVISPTLANVALNGLERSLSKALEAKFGFKKTRTLKVNVVRYADDFVITGNTPEVLDRGWSSS